MLRSRVREERIGFIGLGVMGQPMALNLLASGRRLTIFDRSASLDHLVAAGPTLAAHAREVAAHADGVILMLPDSPDGEFRGRDEWRLRQDGPDVDVT